PRASAASARVLRSRSCRGPGTQSWATTRLGSSPPCVRSSPATGCEVLGGREMHSNFGKARLLGIAFVLMAMGRPDGPQAWQRQDAGGLKHVPSGLQFPARLGTAKLRDYGTNQSTLVGDEETLRYGTEDSANLVITLFAVVEDPVMMARNIVEAR